MAYPVTKQNTANPSIVKAKVVTFADLIKEANQLGAMATVLLSTIYAHLGADGTLQMSDAVLAEVAPMGSRSITKYKKVLADAGLIHYETRYISNSKQSVTVYSMPRLGASGALSTAGNAVGSAGNAPTLRIVSADPPQEMRQATAPDAENINNINDIYDDDESYISSHKDKEAIFNLQKFGFVDAVKVVRQYGAEKVAYWLGMAEKMGLNGGYVRNCLKNDPQDNDYYLSENENEKYISGEYAEFIEF